MESRRSERKRNPPAKFQQDITAYLEARPKKSNKKATSKKEKVKGKNGNSKGKKTSRKEIQEESGSEEDDLLHNDEYPLSKEFDPQEMADFSKSYPDSFGTAFPPFDYLDDTHKHSLERTLPHPGSVCCVTFSPGGEFLASVSTFGIIKIWDSNTWECLTEIKDKNERMIEEFYRIVWSKDGQYVIAGGKRKNRKKWSVQDADNFIEPCPLKVFDILTGEVIRILKGHDEEVYSIKKLTYKGQNYLLTASEEGFLIKWPMNDNFDDIIAPTEYFPDMSTCTVIDITVVPNCGSRYFLTCADSGLKLFDFETKNLVAQWSNLYTNLCNCVKFIPANNEEKNEFLLLTRGTENYADEEHEKPLEDFKAIVHKLSMPTERGGNWELETISRLTHGNYFTKSILAELCSNGRYAFVPSGFGTIFVWDLETYEFKDMVVEPELEWDYEVLDITFHPTKPYLVSGGDDSTIRVFSNELEKFEKREKERLDREKLLGGDLSNNNNNQSSHANPLDDELDCEGSDPE